MALTFVGKGKKASSPKSSKAATKENGDTPSWMKTGKAAQKAIEDADRRQQERFEAAGRAWRFRLQEGEEAQITFVDGELDEDGLLKNPVFKEHNIRKNGKFGNFYVCTSDQEPCPLCEAGDEPSLVQAFTVIDHRPVESKDKKRHYDFVRRLFMAKRNVMKLLQNKAGKYDGLVGVTFDATRTGSNAPSTGDSFDYVQKDNVGELTEYFTRKNAKGKEETIFEVCDYTKEFPYLTAKELRKEGFGAGTPVGAEKDESHDEEEDEDAAAATGGTKSGKKKSLFKKQL